jgi:hypothetical protein
MTTEAPYTPETVITIRRMAKEGRTTDDLARHFGWSHERLRRVCARHAIELPSVNEPPAP